MYVLFDYCFRQRLNNDDVEVNETCCAFFEDNDVININDAIVEYINSVYWWCYIDDVRFNVIKVWEEELYL